MPRPPTETSSLAFGMLGWAAALGALAVAARSLGCFRAAFSCLVEEPFCFGEGLCLVSEGSRADCVASGAAPFREEVAFLGRWPAVSSLGWRRLPAVGDLGLAFSLRTV